MIPTNSSLRICFLFNINIATPIHLIITILLSTNANIESQTLAPSNNSNSYKNPNKSHLITNISALIL